MSEPTPELSQRLVDAAHQAQLGQVVDIAPIEDGENPRTNLLAGMVSLAIGTLCLAYLIYVYSGNGGRVWWLLYLGVLGLPFGGLLLYQAINGQQKGKRFLALAQGGAVAGYVKDPGTAVFPYATTTIEWKRDETDDRTDSITATVRHGKDSFVCKGSDADTVAALNRIVTRFPQQTPQSL